jgi:ATP-binding cassette subfamily B protein
MLRRGIRLAMVGAPRLFLVALAVQIIEALAVVGVIQGLQSVTAALLGEPVPAAPSTLDALVWPGTLLITALAVGAVCQSVQPALATVLGERLAAVTTIEVLRVAGSVPLTDFDRPDVLDRLKRVETGSLIRPAQLAVGLGILLSGAVGAAALTVAVLTVQPWLAAVAVVAAVPLWWAARRDGAQTYETVRGLSRLERRRMYLAGLLTRRERAAEIRALELTPVLLARYDALSQERYREVATTSWDKARRQLRARAAGGLLLAAGFAAVLVMLTGGTLQIPDAVAAAAAGAALRGRLADAATGIRQVQEAAQFVDDHAAVMAAAPAHAGEESEPPAGPAGAHHALEVTLRGVTVRYPGSSVPALRGVDLRIRTGQVVAVVGANGSGKSTLAAVLGGLLAPTTGQVLWDGVDRDGLAVDRWRPDVALLLQDAGRYQETLRDNVAFGAVHRPGDDERIEAALAQSGAAGLLQRYPEGLDTDLGREQDGGAELSGGQWQRIALARTFYRGGRLLILDEPSAPLDPLAERDLVDRVRRSFTNRAVLLITHRMPAAMSADHVVVLDRGSVIEQGTPAALLARGGAFQHMCRAADGMWVRPAA